MEQEKLWNKSFLIMFLINVVNGVAFSLTMPMVSKYAVYLGASLAYAGVITGVFSTAALFARPFAGAASDRLDKKKLMIFSSGGVVLLNLAAALAPNPDTLLVVRIIHGVLFGIGGTTTMALATQFVPRSRIGEGVGFLGMSMTLGNAVGPALGIFIADLLGIRAAFMVTAIGMAVAVACMTLIPPQPTPQFEKGKLPGLRDLISPEVIPLAFFGIIIMMTSGIVSSYLVLVGEERGILGVGIFFTLNAIVMVASRPMAGKLVDKVGLTRTLLPAFACATITMVMLAGAKSLIVVLIAAVFHAFGYGMAHPALQAASIAKLGPERSGVATSTYYIGADLGIGLGPMIGGAIVTASGYAAMFWTMAVLQIVGVVLFLLYSKTQAKKA